jgi:hypothetical protein
MSMSDRADTTGRASGVTATEAGRSDRRLLALLGFCALGALLACGGGDKPGEVAEPVTEEPDGPASDEYTCGSEVCELPEGMTGELCCADQFSGGCGILQGSECRVIPKRDERCPDITASASIRGVPCCAQNGECGVDVGLGCLSTIENCALYPRAVVEQLGRQTCEGEELELAADCGRPEGDDEP